tara:strand:- start:83 stop:790 length:708 start_codon:yes stop_codon:yes gene_type:complete
MKNSIGVVIPAYNPNLKTLEGYVRDLDKVLCPDVILIEIDDPSELVLSQMGGISARFEVSDRKEGKGAAITRGFNKLKSDILVFVDADGSISAKSVKKVCDSIIKLDVDLAVGSRRHPDSNIKFHQGNIRKLLGDGFSVLSRVLLEVKLHDYQCGVKAIDRKVWEEVQRDIERKGFSWDIELISIVSMRGYKIEEIPIEWDDQPGSTVKIIPTVLELFNALFTVRRKIKKLRGAG